MASNTMATWNRRTRKQKNGGRKRKNRKSRHSTPSATELFAGFGEPGKPAPAGATAPKTEGRPEEGAREEARRLILFCTPRDRAIQSSRFSRLGSRMRVCPSCGNTYPDDANFCPMDATRLPAAAAEAPATVPSMPAASPAVTQPDQPRAHRRAVRPAPASRCRRRPAWPRRASDVQTGASVIVKLVARRGRCRRRRWPIARCASSSSSAR